jgi:hyperosmotically inducible protein
MRRALAARLCAIAPTAEAASRVLAHRALTYRRQGAVRPSCVFHRRFTMTTLRATITAALAAATLVASGCAVTRGQETAGAYIDDAAITTAVKARFVDNKDVDASSMHVETLNGTVMLSGFAKNATEKTTAESLARKVNGVKAVKNEIAVRP